MMIIDLSRFLSTGESTLEFDPDFNSPIDLLFGNKHVTEITFGETFNQSIFPLRGNRRITNLSFGFDFNQPIDILETFEALESLKLTGMFNHSIDSLRTLKLTSLTIDGIFNRPIDALSENITLLELKLEGDFNQSIEPLRNNRVLRSIGFGHKFNRPIDALENKKDLERVDFGFNFNHPIDALRNKEKLVTLDLGMNFNQSLEPLRGNISLNNLIITNKELGKQIHLLSSDELEINLSHYIEYFDVLMTLNSKHKLYMEKLLDVVNKFKKLIRRKNIDELEDFLLSGFPIPTRISPRNIIRLDLNDADMEFLTTFSKVYNDPKKLTDFETRIVEEWISDSDINGYLDKCERLGRLDMHTKLYSKNTDNYVNAYTIYETFYNLTVTRRPFVGKTYLYRGVKDMILIDDPVVGEFFESHRFSSTSFEFEVSLVFSTDGQLFLFEVDENTPGYYISIDMGYESEEEVVFAPGTVWEIINLIDDNYGMLGDTKFKQIIHLKYHHMNMESKYTIRDLSGSTYNPLYLP